VGTYLPGKLHPFLPFPLPVHGEVSSISSPRKEGAAAVTRPLVSSTKGWLERGSRFGTRNGFTHFGAAGTKLPVLFCEYAGLYASAVAVAETVAADRPNMRAKNTGRLVFCKLTVTRGFPCKLKFKTGDLTTCAGAPATLF